MPSPFPGMDPFLEKNPIFHELHTQILAEAQGRLQPQVRPKYIVRLKRHLSEGGAWELELDVGSLDRKEPDITISAGGPSQSRTSSTAVLARPTASSTQALEREELELRKQRRIVIYVNARPRLAVATIELLSPSNKDHGSIGQQRYVEKRASALHGGIHWIEIDLLRGGERPPMPVELSKPALYLGYVAQATSTGWNHLAYAWDVRDRLPVLPIPLLGSDQAQLDLQACFDVAYDRIGADDEAGYEAAPPLPALSAADASWVAALLRGNGLRS